jgi:hypothetical protein
MTTYQSTAHPQHLAGWLLAGFVAQGLLPWVLARAAKAASRRDFVDCGEAAPRTV